MKSKGWPSVGRGSARAAPAARPSTRADNPWSCRAPDLRHQHECRQHDAAEQEQHFERRSKRRPSQYLRLMVKSRDGPACDQGTHRRNKPPSAPRTSERPIEPPSDPPTDLPTSATIAADHLVGDRARDIARNELTGRQPAAAHIGAEDGADDRSDMPEMSAAGRVHRRSPPFLRGASAASRRPTPRRSRCRICPSPGSHP